MIDGLLHGATASSAPNVNITSNEGIARRIVKVGLRFGLDLPMDSGQINSS
jgi:hypothetical protein